MLDESLPTFYLKKSGEQKHQWTIYHTQHGNEPEPAYALRYLDPSLPTSKNRFAAALYDPYVPDVVYGEVLIIPEWTQPSLSAEAIRLNGGVAPPPEPIMPSQFTVQLYNPDQQVVIRYNHKTWNTPATWEFELPQRTFRQPSISTLDRTQSDPAVADVTPKLKFSWRKDSKLSKDLTCLLSGKTTVLPESKTKSKEPDITISIFKSLREITLYEPNLYRVEMEDFKGLEVVLLLGAVTIRHVFFTPMKEAFHVSNNLPMAAAPTLARKQPSPRLPTPGPPVASGALNANAKPPASDQPTSPPARPRITIPQRESRPPQLDARSQWEVDAENARLRQQLELEKQRRNAQVHEEDRRTKKLLEAEEKARRKKQVEIDKETRRLQKLYGKEEEKVRGQTQSRPPPAAPNLPPRNHGRSQAPEPRYYYSHHHAPSVPNVGAGPYLQVRPQSVFYNRPQPQPAPQLQPKKSSFFGFRKSSAEHDARLMKKRSSMF